MRSAVGDCHVASPWLLRSHFHLAHIIGEYTPCVAIPIMAFDTHAIAFVVRVHRPCCASTKEEGSLIFTLVSFACGGEFVQVEVPILVLVSSLEDVVSSFVRNLGARVHQGRRQ